MFAQPTPRHVKDGNGELRHMRGAHRDRPVHPARRMLAPSGVGLAFAAKLMTAWAASIRLRNQGSEGCCVGESAAEVTDGSLAKVGLLTPATETSEQDCYAIARIQQGTPLDEDSGSTGQDVVDAMTAMGACTEQLRPFSDSPASYSEARTPEQAGDGARRKLVLDLVCPTVQSMKLALSQGFGLLTGFACYESLMSAEVAQTGLVPFPEPGEQQIGGHELSVWGWDDTVQIGPYTGAFICRNHWGEWGATYDGVKGYALLPYQYWTAELAGDNHSPRLWLPTMVTA